MSESDNQEIVNELETEQPVSTRRITSADVDVTADVAAIFEGAELTEEFKTKASEIFTAALVHKINEAIEEIETTNAANVEAETAELTEALQHTLDEYLDYVIEQWMEDNKLAVETGLKSQMSEEFLTGLRTLFSEHYVNIPEGKTDVVEELAAKVETLESSLNEEITKNIELKKQISSFEREVAIVEVSEGLTDTQIAKLETLSEAIECTNAENFKAKLKTLREAYFPVSSPTTSVTQVTLDDEPIAENDAESVPVDPAMRNYMNAITRSLKK